MKKKINQDRMEYFNLLMRIKNICKELAFLVKRLKK